MADYVNFFETKKEADMRLRGTIVLYDGQPYYVLAVGDHFPDGVFRLYLDPISSTGMAIQNYHNLPNADHSTASMGALFDDFMTHNPSAPIIRKKMNSPKFNKFRPFPLGMCNMDSTVYYIERQPTRKSEQGLTQNMLHVLPITLSPHGNKPMPGPYFSTHSDDFRACILGDYPTPYACIAALKNPKVSNDAAAFHREFAFVRGPLDSLYLAYKGAVIGLLPNSDLAEVRLGKEFAYTREVVEGLNLFAKVSIH